MALKFKITAAQWAKLSDEMKAEYNAEGEGYTLDVSGLEDTGALKRGKDREVELHKETKAKLAEAEEKLAEAEANGGKKDKDVAKLEKSWEAKVTEATKAGEAKIAARDAFIKKTLVDARAEALAAEISTMPKLMAKELKDRMVVEFDGDEPQFKILDKNGKPSEMTITQLKEETLANKEFAGILIGSKASGSGAGKDGFNKTNGGGAPSQKQETAVPFAKLAPSDLAAQLKAKKEAKAQTQ